MPLLLKSPALVCAVAHMIHALLFGLYLSLGFRIQILWIGKEKFKAMLDSKEFKVAHGTQMNNTEWTPYFVAALLYLHAQGAGSTYTAYGSLVSCFCYSSLKLLTVGRPTPICAGTRYVMLAALIYEVYATGA